MSKLVIFLDIDGVLNDAPTMIKTQDENPSQPHLNCLKQIVEATDAKIVLTSTWRLFPSSRFIVDNSLKSVGLTVAAMTEDLASRDEEIRTFLSKSPQVINYVILDDEEMETPSLVSHQVLTDFNEGLQAKHVTKAIKILKAGEK